MENKIMHHTVSDEALNTVTGGAAAETAEPLFAIGDSVYYSITSRSGKTGTAFGQVTERRYDAAQGTWLYTVQSGFLTGPTSFVPQGAAAEYPESALRSER